jgi:phosphatidylserine synthase
MVDEMMRNMSKKTWYKWSFYINIVLFFVVALFLYLLVIDSIKYGELRGDTWLLVTRDVAFVSVSLALIFAQFIRHLFIIMRRSL